MFVTCKPYMVLSILYDIPASSASYAYSLRESRRRIEKSFVILQLTGSRYARGLRWTNKRRKRREICERDFKETKCNIHMIKIQTSPHQRTGASRAMLPPSPGFLMDCAPQAVEPGLLSHFWGLQRTTEVKLFQDHKDVLESADQL